MTLLRYDNVKHRLWVGGKRIHHGAAGLFACVMGITMMIHDWKDRPWTRDND